ncbi:hypothetical protein ACJ72_02807 [Emergomyces africanus]|uniref:Uncharacterized protein n=1 Tax=Emergomyces africanus TaxID=1955775 RepID=A0A1B7P1E7_9EURO|nr:hypothetical protein ACJ72_02807 [Emergomyces africanus]
MRLPGTCFTETVGVEAIEYNLTGNRPADNIVGNGHANPTINARQITPDDKFAPESIQCPTHACTDTPIQHSTATTKSELLKVDTSERDSILPGIIEAAAACSDFELSSQQDVSSSPDWRVEETTLHTTAPTDIDPPSTVQMANEVLIDATLNEIPDLDCSSRPPLDVSREINTNGFLDSNTQAVASGAQSNCNEESAPTRIQLSENATVDGNTTEAELTVGAPAIHTSEAKVEHACQSSPAPTPASKPEQSQESIPRDVIFSGVTGPARLANKILEIDGRITEPPHGNAWKEFRCYRDNQDMGSLWECRQAWFMRRK